MKNWSWYGYVILGLIIFGLFFFLYYKPKNAQLQNLKAERMKTEEEVQRLRVKKQQLDKIEAEMKTLAATLKELEVIIPQKKEVSDILRRTQQLAFDSRLNIVNFAPSGEINKNFYSEWPIYVDITGNYNNLAIFFDRLSRFSRLFNIEKFSIRSLAQQTEDATISASWTAKTYIFLEESPTPQGKNPPTGKK